MKPILQCTIYLAICGIGSFFLGRILPKTWFHFNHFPYRSFPFEQEGRIYHRIGVRKWKDAMPDMSRIAPALIPSKRIPPRADRQAIEEMLQETCVAEWTHALLILLGFGCVFLWEGSGGWILSTVYGIGNLPYIIIQRHNRPKLVRILKKKEMAASR